MKKPLNIRRQLPAVLAGSLAAFLAAQSAHAASATWNAAPASAAWNASNWTGGAGTGGLPASGDSLVFGSSTQTTLTNDLTSGAAWIIPSITFSSGASAYTISGNTFTLGTTTTGTVIFNNSTSLQTINNNITLANTAQYVSLTTGGGNVTLNGVISGAGTSAGLRTTGTGTLTLTGANTYSGLTLIGQYTTVRTNNASGLGTNTSVAMRGGTLDLRSDSSLTFGAGNGYNLSSGGYAVLINVDRDQSSTATGNTLTLGDITTNSGSINGVLTVTGSHGYILAARTVTVMNTTLTNNAAGMTINTLAIGGSGTTTTITGSGYTTVGGITSTGANLIKNGTGTLTLNGGSSTVGTITVGGGKLAVNSNLTSGAVAVNNGATLAGSGTLSGAVTIASGAHFAPGNSISTTFTTGSLTLSAGSATDIELGTANAIAALSVNDRATVNGVLALGGTLNLIDNAGANSQGSVGAGQYQIFTGASAVTGAFSNIVNVSGYHANVDSTSSVGNVYVNNYQIAAASITSGTTVSLGITHVGQSFTSSTVNIKNTAASNGYAEGLNATASGTTGVATLNGSNISNLAGGSTSTSFTVGLSDTSVGAKSGTVTVGFASNKTNSGYATDTTLASQTISVTGQVNYYAAPEIAFTSGDGEFASSGSNYTLTLGTFDLNDADKIFTTVLTLSNKEFDAIYQDILEGTLTLTGNGFTLTGLRAVSLASGSSTQLTISFNTADLITEGTYTGLLTLSGTSVNTSESTSLNSVSVAMELQVVPEPATWSMIVGGLGMMVFIQRMRRQMSR